MLYFRNSWFVTLYLKRLLDVCLVTGYILVFKINALKKKNYNDFNFLLPQKGTSISFLRKMSDSVYESTLGW